MTNEEAIKILKSKMDGSVDTSYEWAETVRMAIKALKQSEPHWIPCSERLPLAEYGESDNVLATCGHRDGEDTSARWIRTLYFNGGCWCYPTGETYDQKVYAWMPLPEAYREGERWINMDILASKHCLTIAKTLRITQ